MFARTKMTRRTWLATLAVVALTPALFLTGCGGDDDDDNVTEFITTLTGTPGLSGVAQVTINEERDLITVNLTTQGTFNPPVTNIELRVASTPGGTGPAVFTLYNSATGGTWTGSLNRSLASADFTSGEGVATFEAAVNRILQGLGYIVVRSGNTIYLRGNLDQHNQGGGG